MNNNSIRTTSITISTKTDVSRLLMGIITCLIVITVLNYLFPVLSAVLITIAFIDACIRMDKHMFTSHGLQDLIKENFKDNNLDISHKLTLENGFIENRVSVELKEKAESVEEADLEEKIKANKKSK